MSVGWVGAAAAVGGALISADASSSASNAQQDAVNQANGLTYTQSQQQRQDNMPWLQAGGASQNRLAYLLGLSTLSGLPGQNLDAPSRQNIFNQYEAQLAQNGVDVAYSRLTAADQARRDATVDQMYKDALNQYQASQLGNAQQDSAYGSLTRGFTQADWDADPISQKTYQTALDNGNQSINRLAAAGGNLNSGATLKALTRFGANTANTYGNEAFNRFNTTQGNTFNRLAGISNSGQQAVNTVGAASMNAANTIGQNVIGMGNARGASAVAGGNALSQGLGNAYGNYQTNQLLSGLYSKNNTATGVGAIYNDINQSGSGYRRAF